MPSEDQDILAKISQLAGQINRVKNSTPVTSPRPPAPTYPQTSASANTHGSTDLLTNMKGAIAYESQGSQNARWRPEKGVFGSSRYIRGGRPAQVHRNKTLVLNGNKPSTFEQDVADESEEGVSPSAKSVQSRPSFVAKNDRHMQLINTDIYQKESLSRVKAIADSRRQRLLQRDHREKEKFKRHLQRTGGNRVLVGETTPRTTSDATMYEVIVEDKRFRVVKNGSKLVKFSGDLSTPSTTPKTALIGGVRFHRSKNGNMYRAGVVKAHRRHDVAQKINEPCKTFTLTGICTKGLQCRYVHDPSKVTACKSFLLKGSCPSGDSCNLSHDLTPERTPACLHFAKGNCSNANCRYSHIRVSPTAPVCRPFAIYGYCGKGNGCGDRHVHECPDFSNSGTCSTKGCKLPHQHKANIMRKNYGRGDISAGESSDLSSDEDAEEIGSDDVDSDDLDEQFIGDDMHGDPDITMEQDFLQLS